MIIIKYIIEHLQKCNFFIEFSSLRSIVCLSLKKKEEVSSFQFCSVFQYHKQGVVKIRTIGMKRERRKKKQEHAHEKKVHKMIL